MKIIEEFIHKESSSGILLIATTFLALALQNSPWSLMYESILHIPVEIRFGELFIQKTFNHWINDGLMAFFFLLIGLEVKREMIEGQLSTPSKLALPGIAAVGGMLVPACIYVFFNADNPIAIRGWAIPTATDIAFALGILSLLGLPITHKSSVTRYGLENIEANKYKRLLGVFHESIFFRVTKTNEDNE